MVYKSFDDHELSLSDMLAVDRTALANERTLLAYLRTAIMLGVSSVSLIKLFPDSVYAFAAGIMIGPLAIFVAILGIRRYFGLFQSLVQMRRKRRRTKNRPEPIKE